MNPIKNIAGDYLWDRTGKPDPEIQQLEEILGTLHYQSRSLAVPVRAEVGRERNLFRGSAPRLAIAATIVMLLLGLGLWLGLQRLQRGQPSPVANTVTPAVNPNVARAPSLAQDPKVNLAAPGGSDQKRPDGPPRYRVNRSLLARNPTRTHNHAGNKNQALARNKLPEAEAARDQLMLALRVASAKLSFAQRKTQALSQRDLVHNQHKIG